jgi:hypothetical protein
MNLKGIIKEVLNESPAPAAPTPVKEPDTKPSPTPNTPKERPRRDTPERGPGTEPNPEAVSPKEHSWVRRNLQKFLSKRGLNLDEAGNE